MNEQPRGIGDNLPPAIPTAEQINDALGLDQIKLLRRRDELIEALDRVPLEIEDPETEQKVTDFGSQIAAAIKAAEASRVGAKEPYLAGGRAVDGFFAKIVDPLLTAKSTLAKRLTIYKRKREDEERQRRAAAWEAKQEAERKAREEQAAREKELTDDASLKTALAAREAADRAAEERARAQQAAEVKPAELSGSRGDMGGYSSLRTTWDFRDLDRTELDLEALRSHFPLDGLEKAVRSFIRAGGRKLAGVEIYERKETQIR